VEEDWGEGNAKMPEVQCQVLWVVMVWGAMSAAGVCPMCFIKSRVNAASYQEILEHFMLPLLKSFMEMKI